MSIKTMIAAASVVAGIVLTAGAASAAPAAPFALKGVSEGTAIEQANYGYRTRYYYRPRVYSYYYTPRRYYFRRYH